MEQRERPHISPLVLRLMPDASDDEQLAAQMNVDNVIAVLCRICDRIVRERQEAARDKESVYARLESTDDL